MKRIDWLLLLIDGEMDPIRVQKAMFLFAMQSGAPQRQLYAFRPYNWGPFSRAIYDDLERLLAEGLIERVPAPGAGYSRYRRTDAGNSAAQNLTAAADAEAAGLLAQIRAEVTGRSFDNLLQWVYANYPEYAVESIFRRAPIP